jgi:integrase
METTEKQFLTRAELAQFLTSRGYPIAKSTLDKLCQPSRGDGPPMAKRWMIAASPMQGMERPWTGAKPRSRDWFKKEAGDAAITSLWHCADQIGGLEGRYLKVMLVLGKRKTALANMRWEEIDSSWYWDAPASTVKNKRLHGVPLPPLVQRVLHPRQAQGRVFDDLALEPLQAKIRRLSGISDFFFHGVRHLCETKCAELRDDKGPVILPHIRDLLFDHVSKRGSGKGYDHHDYRNELRAALTVWSEYIERLVQSPQDKVTVLR